MINHVSIGVRDVARSKKFYNAALKPLGYKLVSDGETSLGYGDKSVALWVQKSDSPVPADMASGLHFCFDAPSRKSVDGFHKGAMGAGGKDNRPAGLRADYGDNYYAGFVIDPDGYRLEAYCDKAS